MQVESWRKYSRIGFFLADRPSKRLRSMLSIFPKGMSTVKRQHFFSAARKYKLLIFMLFFIKTGDQNTTTIWLKLNTLWSQLLCSSLHDRLPRATERKSLASRFIHTMWTIYYLRRKQFSTAPDTIWRWFAFEIKSPPSHYINI